MGYQLRKVDFTFGLVAFPARVMRATDDPPSNKTLCVGGQGEHADEHDPSPINEHKTCPVCGPITAPYALKKGVQTPDGYAVVDVEEIDAARAETSGRYKGKVAIVPVKRDEFEGATQQGEALSFLLPEPKASHDLYALFTRLVESHPDLAFICLHTPSSRQALYVLRAQDGRLLMEERVLADRLREPEFEVAGTVNDALYAQLDTFLPSMIESFDPEAYEDTYAAVLAKRIGDAEVVQIGGTATATPAAPAPDVNSLTEAFAQLNADVAKRAKRPVKKATAKKTASAKA